MRVNTTPLTACLKAILSQGNDDVTVVPSEEGWRMQAVSSDHVSMAAAGMVPDCFPEGYEVWEPFTFSGKELMDSLPSEGDADLDISTGRLVVKAGGYTYRKRLLGGAGEGRNMPELECDMSANPESDTLVSFLGKGIGYTDAVRFTVRDGTLTLAMENGEGIGVTLDLPPATGVLAEGNGYCLYPASHVGAMAKAAPKGTVIALSWMAERPLCASYGGEGWNVRWLCAPRIEEDGA